LGLGARNEEWFCPFESGSPSFFPGHASYAWKFAYQKWLAITHNDLASIHRNHKIIAELFLHYLEPDFSSPNPLEDL